MTDDKLLLTMSLVHSNLLHPIFNVLKKYSKISIL